MTTTVTREGYIAPDIDPSLPGQMLVSSNPARNQPLSSWRRYGPLLLPKDHPFHAKWESVIMHGLFNISDKYKIPTTSANALGSNELPKEGEKHAPTVICLTVRPKGAKMKEEVKEVIIEALSMIRDLDVGEVFIEVSLGNFWGSLE